MNRIRTLTTAALVAAVTATVLAQDALTKRVTLDLKAVEPATAFNTIAGAVGLKVIVDPAVTAPVDIVVRNVRASTALDTICDSIGCAWKVEGGTLNVTPASAILLSRSGGTGSTPGQEGVARIQKALSTKLPDDLVFTNATLTEVSARLSVALGLQISIETDGKGPQTLTADLRGHTLQTALKIIVDGVKSDAKGGMSLTIRLGKGDDPQQTFGLKISARAPAKK